MMALRCTSLASLVLGSFLVAEVCEMIAVSDMVRHLWEQHVPLSGLGPKSLFRFWVILGYLCRYGYIFDRALCW